MNSIAKPKKFIPLALIATTLWGSAFAGAKIGFEYMPPIMLSGIRFTLAGALLIPVAFALKVSWKEQLKHWKFIFIFGFIQTFLQYGLFYMGLDLVPGALSAIIIGAGPLFIAIIAHFLVDNDKLKASTVFAILLGLSGVIFISLSGGATSIDSPHFYRGVILLVTSNIIGSFTNIMVVKHNKPISPIVLTMLANLFGGLLLFIVSLFVEDRTILLTSFPLKFHLAILWLAIIPAASFSIWYYLLSLPGVKVSELNVWKFTIPVVGVLLSWLLLPNEHPTWISVTGIIIISTAVLVLQIPRKRATSQKG
ncbi:MAG: DMT family transporter [Rikenellaceae bacterium]